jgi:hypothetical protein
MATIVPPPGPAESSAPAARRRGGDADHEVGDGWDNNADCIIIVSGVNNAKKAKKRRRRPLRRDALLLAVAIAVVAVAAREADASTSIVVIPSDGEHEYEFDHDRDGEGDGLDVLGRGGGVRRHDADRYERDVGDRPSMPRPTTATTAMPRPTTATTAMPRRDRRRSLAAASVEGEDGRSPLRLHRVRDDGDGRGDGGGRRRLSPSSTNPPPSSPTIACPEGFRVRNPEGGGGVGGGAEERPSGEEDGGGGGRFFLHHTTYAASFPGSGDRMITKYLVEGMTGLGVGEASAANGGDDGGGGGSPPRRGEVVAVRTQWPHTSGKLAPWDDDVQRAFVVLRNPLHAIPCYFDRL